MVYLLLIDYILSLGIEKLLWLFTCDGNLEMIKYMLSLEEIEDPVMADGTTAFSMALAKGRCDIIKEFLRIERSSDMELASLAALEPNINVNMKKALLKSTKSCQHTVCNLKLCLKPCYDSSDFQVPLHPSRV